MLDSWPPIIHCRAPFDNHGRSAHKSRYELAGKKVQRKEEIMGETKLTAAGLARSMTLFDIDEDLDLLIHGAEEEAEANNGEVPEQLKTAIMEYFEAHLRKVDRIVGYVRAQDAESQIA